jgi:hypothetical protein
VGSWLRRTASDRTQQSFLDHVRHRRHHQAYQPSLHLPKERPFENIVHGIAFQDSIAHIAMVGASRSINTSRAHHLRRFKLAAFRREYDREYYKVAALDRRGKGSEATLR